MLAYSCKRILAYGGQTLVENERALCVKSCTVVECEVADSGEGRGGLHRRQRATAVEREETDRGKSLGKRELGDSGAIVERIVSNRGKLAAFLEDYCLKIGALTECALANRSYRRRDDYCLKRCASCESPITDISDCARNDDRGDRRARKECLVSNSNNSTLVDGCVGYLFGYFNLVSLVKTGIVGNDRGVARAVFKRKSTCGYLTSIVGSYVIVKRRVIFFRIGAGDQRNCQQRCQDYQSYFFHIRPPRDYDYKFIHIKLYLNSRELSIGLRAVWQLLL